MIRSRAVTHNFLQKRTIFLHARTTCSELSSNISAKHRSRSGSDKFEKANQDLEVKKTVLGLKLSNNFSIFKIKNFMTLFFIVIGSIFLGIKLEIGMDPDPRSATSLQFKQSWHYPCKFLLSVQEYGKDTEYSSDSFIRQSI